MKENLTGKAFVRQIGQGKYMQNVFELNESVNVRVLSEAWRRSLHDCPFFDQTLTMKDGCLFYAPLRSACRILTLEEGRKFTSDIGGELIYIAAEEKTIVIGIAHAMTDGFGAHAFGQLVLYHYFCLLDGADYPKPKIYDDDGVIRFDEDSDLLADLPESHSDTDAGFGIGSGEKTVLPLQLKEIEPAGTAVFVISTDDAQFKNAMRETIGLSEEHFTQCNRELMPMGGLPSVFIAHLVAQAIDEALPENTRPIGCRFPLNTRSAYGKNHAVRNYSMPQVAWEMHPETQRETEWTVWDTDEILSVLKPQLAPERFEVQLRELRDMIEGKSAKPGPAISRSFQQTFLVSNIGKIAYEPELGRIRYAGVIFPGFPIMIYLSRLADRQLLTITQTFSTDRYVNGLIRGLQGAGVTDCVPMEVEGLKL